MGATIKTTGRPSVVTDTCVRKLEEAFRSGLDVSSACDQAGISRTTYYDHLNTHSVFSDRMSRAQQWLVARAKGVIAKEIESGNVSVARWYLERKAPEEFGVRPAIANPPSKPNLTFAQWEALLEADRAAREILETPEK